MKPAPKADELVFAGVRFREPQSTFHGLGTARIRLQPVQSRGWRTRGQTLDQLDPSRRRERADRRCRHLLLNRCHEGRVRVAKRVHGNTADEIDEGIAIDVGHRAAPPLFHDDAGHHGIALQARRHVRILATAQLLALRPRHRGHQLGSLILGLGGIDGGAHDGFSLLGVRWAKTNLRCIG